MFKERKKPFASIILKEARSDNSLQLSLQRPRLVPLSPLHPNCRSCSCKTASRWPGRGLLTVLANMPTRRSGSGRLISLSLGSGPAPRQRRWRCRRRWCRVAACLTAAMHLPSRRLPKRRLLRGNTLAFAHALRELLLTLRHRHPCTPRLDGCLVTGQSNQSAIHSCDGSRAAEWVLHGAGAR